MSLIICFTCVIDLVVSYSLFSAIFALFPESYLPSFSILIVALHFIDMAQQVQWEVVQQIINQGIEADDDGTETVAHLWHHVMDEAMLSQSGFEGAINIWREIIKELKVTYKCREW